MLSKLKDYVEFSTKASFYNPKKSQDSLAPT